MTSALAARFKHGPRRGVWANDGRVHVQVRDVDADDRAAFVKRLQKRVEALDGVAWARYNGYLARLVVSYDASRCSPEEIVAAVALVEEEMSASESFARAAPGFPGDAEPEHRTWIEVAADAVSLAASTALRFSSREKPAHDIDFAAVAAVLDGIPRVRKSIAKSVSRRAADLSLELLKSTAQVVVQSETGPLTGLLSHALAMRESHGRRATWTAREPELCGAPEQHPPRALRRKDRPAPLRNGPIERYEAAAVPLALGTFGAGLFVTRDIQTSAPPLFAGMPRAARLGRSAFAAHVGWLLSRRGALVVDGEVLRRLDRVDTLAITAELALRDEPGARRITRRARESGLEVRLVGDGAHGVPWLGASERCDHRAGVSKAVRRLQRSGGGVMVVADGSEEELRAGDVRVALSAEHAPWGAHIIARYGVDDALILIDAIAQAKSVAEQSVGIALAEAATGAVMTFAGLERKTTQRVMTLANAAAAVAMLNGVRLAHGIDAPIPAPPKDETPYHAMSPDDVMRLLGSGPGGLSPADAAARVAPRTEPPSRARRYASALYEELASPITTVLVAGAGLSAAVGSVVDAGLIVGALGVNGLAGAAQRVGARNAIEALSEREERAIQVVRGGRTIDIAPRELAAGDVVELGAGEIVPADCRLLEAIGLELDESSLTGESLPVAKDVRAIDTDVLAERTSMLYAGTSLASGRARAIVVATGDDTEIGRARASIERRPRPRGVEARLEELASITGPVAGLSALGIMGAGLLRDRPFAEVITSAVGLGVAAVPEGLPILSTLAQLAAARRLTKRGALVRNPRSLEALGRVDVLCADKTGTLTEGRIRLAVLSDGWSAVDVPSAGGELREILSVALRASAERNGARTLPHPTEEALVAGAESIGIGTAIGAHEYRRGPELPFEPARGFSAAIGWDDGVGTLSVKGAPEVVLPRCARAGDRRLKKRTLAKLLKHARSLGRQGYRVLAVAERAASIDRALSEDDARELTFLGFVGLADPVRASSRAALADLRDAGVRVVMVTGDHPSTAMAIAGELSLDGEAIIGAELDELDDDALADRIERCSIFARVTPAQKVRIVRVLSSRGKTVAMTGDGANDAAAIALADVGIAVGARATGAARSVADLVVTDGRIETIVDAILEGRAMWASVRDAVSILVGGNFGEIGFTLLPGLITGQPPLNARQLLLVNLVTDTLPSLAIAVAPPRREDAEKLLREGPEASLGKKLDRDLATRALITGGAAAVAYTMSRLTGGGAAKAGTVGLITLTGAQLGQTLVAGGRDVGVFAAAVGSLAALFTVVQVPVLSHFFGCRPLGPIALAQAIGVTAAATGVAWAAPRWLERRAVQRELKARAAKIADSDRTLLIEGEEPEDELFGGLASAA